MKNEAELAALVMARLEADGWDCYPEAQFRSYLGRADIAAKRGRILWVVECKTTFGLSVIAQARAWKGYANYRSVAVPMGRSSGGRSMASEICALLGIGILEVGKDRVYGGTDNRVRELIRPRLDRKVGYGLVDCLHPDMKRYAPGTTSGEGYSTPFSRTMDRCIEFIKERPGCTVKELIESIDHHYASLASAKTAIPYWLDSPKFPVDVRKEKGRLRLYPNEQAK